MDNYEFSFDEDLHLVRQSISSQDKKMSFEDFDEFMKKKAEKICSKSQINLQLNEKIFGTFETSISKFDQTEIETHKKDFKVP